MKRSIPPVLITFSLVCFALVQNTQAVSPAPDGGYPNFNTAEGDDALFSLTTGANNTAIGYQALYMNTIGGANTAIGYQTLFRNTTGSHNTATGANALINNSFGNNNTANGVNALTNNTNGYNNTAAGANALALSTVGRNNTADGVGALRSNTFRGESTAIGANALFHNTSENNTAIGANALLNSSLGGGNIAIGVGAGFALTTGSDNIEIGNTGASGGESFTIRIGNTGTHIATFIAGISGRAVAGATVTVNNSGKLGVAPSSQRFKTEIKPMDTASEAIFALKPVTFRYRKDIDALARPQFGLVAEDVEKVNPDLVVADNEGKAYTVRYEAVNAMLLNEFLKDHKRVEEQQNRIEKQEATIARQQKQIEALTAGLQKVSAHLEASKPTPQVVANNH